MVFNLNMVLGILIVFFASILQGLMGFGYAIVAAPLLMLIFLPKLVVPIILIQSSINNIIIIASLLKENISQYVNLKKILRLIIAGIIGIPIGTFLLISVEEETIKIFSGIVIIIFSIFQLIGFHKPVKNEKVASVIVGLISGILAGSIAISGPPVVLFLMNQNVIKNYFRVSIVIYFIVLGLIAILSMYISKILNMEVIHYFLSLFPAMVFGLSIGIYLSKKVNESLFKLATIFIVLVSGILAISSGFNII